MNRADLVKASPDPADPPPAIGLPRLVLPRRQAKVRTHCGDCAMAMDVWIDTETVEGKGLVHFAVPARDWWQDIVFS